ncbi:phosphoinositide phosphatase SAC2-like isoform X2 [Solanum tuberosum]|uniref:phosphoinositide phosphatase SAC2-like isoform X2 n=1 Tax=Solanum tuberosum TaxID=4113 RepID=UPI0003D296E3|nr:PREDICTED: phosphoinositide phosphatase SAC2-like isoform X2 [Solanum tuberosum]
MEMEIDSKERHEINLQPPKENNFYLQKFRLYETRSNFYMIGWDNSKTIWKVLKIDRLESSELLIHEDPTIYSEREYLDLLSRIHEGNKSTGGLKFVCLCYGIIGFIKFLGAHYLLVITERREIGKIRGHVVYTITESEMFPVPNSTVLSKMAYSKDENRYLKLLRKMDLTKDYFFSYSYHMMLSFQKNLSNSKTGVAIYETMFVWNEFLTREIHNQLQNTHWTVALVYGFFKQATFKISSQDFILTLIARRSRHYAGTRYLKRGVNEKGRVANDVETEQIVFEDVPEGSPFGATSVVQNRGSIPLFWSQETSRLNVKPDIILSRRDFKFEATKLHFEDLVQRYGNPIIILNLIKTLEKRPREMILRAEFANAIEFLNKDLPEDDRLRFLHWDINKRPRIKAKMALIRLSDVAANALELTGFLHCQLIPTSRTEELQKLSPVSCDDRGDHVKEDLDEMDVEMGNECDKLRGAYCVKVSSVQNGVLRTNCVDCLDRTNVGQYAYGLVALSHQLHALGFVDVDNINIDSHSPLAQDLMQIYEEMGDTLSLQYGGSAAHNKVFSEMRGQWKATTRSQEIIRSVQRFYRNAYMDPEKQDAINVFLGHFQPQEGGPALWELNPDQHYDVRKHGSSPTAERSRYNPSMSSRQLFHDIQLDQCLGSSSFKFDEGALFDSSNFLDVDWLSSSGNSCEEETYDRSSIIGSPSRGMSSNSMTNELKAETNVSAPNSGASLKKVQTPGDISVDAKVSKEIHRQYSEKFIRWVNEGDVLFH